jgi:ubiquitin-conjugating enzyme E2 D
MNRLKNEWQKLKDDPLDNISAGPINKDFYNWEANIIGPSNSVYQGAIFHLTLNIPENYPFKPPKIKFTTPIYHPNINKFGDICLDTITTNWSPIMSIGKVLLSICSLLTDPNPDDPLEPQIAELYKNNRAEYNRNARLFTIQNTI